MQIAPENAACPYRQVSGKICATFIRHTDPGRPRDHTKKDIPNDKGLFPIPEPRLR
ncbi:hypothetical protein MACH17_25060 [Phaeobacter inhibens]|nr:hypothetical protein MACH17_25060 [Phaeobacter inhibens]